MTNRKVEHCYAINALNNLSQCLLYKKFTIRLEDAPIAYYWKKIRDFSSIEELKIYCINNDINDIVENRQVVNGKIEYLV